MKGERNTKGKTKFFRFLLPSIILAYLKLANVVQSAGTIESK